MGPIILSLGEYLPFPSCIFFLAMALAICIITISVAVERLNRMDQRMVKFHQEALDAWHFFEGVVENIEDAVAVLDKEGNAIYKNRRMKEIDFKIQDHWEKPPKTPIHIKKTRIDNRYFTGWIIPLDKKNL